MFSSSKFWKVKGHQWPSISSSLGSHYFDFLMIKIQGSLWDINVPINQKDQALVVEVCNGFSPLQTTSKFFFFFFFSDWQPLARFTNWEKSCLRFMSCKFQIIECDWPIKVAFSSYQVELQTDFRKLRSFSESNRDCVFSHKWLLHYQFSCGISEPLIQLGKLNKRPNRSQQTKTRPVTQENKHLSSEPKQARRGRSAS